MGDAFADASGEASAEEELLLPELEDSVFLAALDSEAGAPDDAAEPAPEKVKLALSFEVIFSDSVRPGSPTAF